MDNTLLMWAALGGVLIIAIIGFFEWRMAALRTRLRVIEDGGQQVGESVEGMSYGAVALGERLNRVEQHMRKLASDIAKLHEGVDQMSLSEGENRAFTQAIRMAGKGADVKELMETCDLSQGEAELVVLLHSRRAGSSPADTDETVMHSRPNKF